MGFSHSFEWKHAFIKSNTSIYPFSVNDGKLLVPKSMTLIKKLTSNYETISNAIRPSHGISYTTVHE